MDVWRRTGTIRSTIVSATAAPPICDPVAECPLIEAKGAVEGDMTAEFVETAALS